MRDMQDQKQIFDLLDRTLETYGADPARWPAGVHSKVSAFVSNNQDAQRRIVEARALENVLSFAPNIPGTRHAGLANQIVSRAIRQPRAVTSNELPAASTRKLPTAAGATSWRRQALTSGTLAASLMLGILAGQNATVVTLADAVLTSGKMQDAATQQIAQSDDIETLWDEDLL